MKKILLILIILTSSSFVENVDPILDNYYRAVTNMGSTIQFYAVINVRENNSDIYREVCVTGFDIYSIIVHQENIDWEDFEKVTRKAKKNKLRNFTLTDSNLKANIDRIKYSQMELFEFDKIINSDSIAKSTINNSKWYYTVSTEKEEVMVAHLLFNKGIMVAINECIGEGRVFLSDGY